MSSLLSAAPFLPLFSPFSLMPLICSTIAFFFRSIDLSTQRKKCNLHPFKSILRLFLHFFLSSLLKSLDWAAAPPPGCAFVPSLLLSFFSSAVNQERGEHLSFRRFPPLSLSLFLLHSPIVC